MSTRAVQSRLALLAAVLAGALAIASPASADIGETIILRCTHGESLAGFSQSAYDKALKELSADAEEYSTCASQIRQAQLAAAGGGGTAGAGEAAAALPATPAEQAAIAHASKTQPGPLRLAGQLVQPGVVHANVASALSSLPSPLLATFAFLLACLVLALGAGLRNRVRGQRPD